MNMSYCRFQNTARDFQDCVENIRTIDPEDQSQNAIAERRARADLLRLAAALMNELGVEDTYDSTEVEDTIVDLNREPAVRDEEEAQ